ncbi:hypothetical protein [Methylobacterium sp. R2-1]|uniref:hypothetical protein n=1 Tax=Methylobacterium sp. R2-1 TaxID=2587064 RepID=UPI001613AC97|nr:hypothetical protein [Methylobacterium sp. R2-1]MBB2964389.1 hypothetical protein [Methylobacterium sp. R2-1]
MIPASHPIARAVLCAAAALLMTLPAAARGPDFDFPAEVAGFARGPRTDYEARAPGLGYSVVYTNGRWKADIYVYDAGVANIPDGASSSAVTGQLAQAAGDIRAAVAQGVYRGSEDRGAVRVPGEAGAKLTCRAFTIDHPALGATESLLCLTGLRGQFVKFRLSGPAAKQPTKAEAERFMTGWLGRQ